MKTSILPVMLSSLPLEVALGHTAHQQAEHASQFYQDWQIAEQAYLNALSVYAVDHYLQCLGFETDDTFQAFQDGVTQRLADTADLNIKDYGTLECRRVLPDASVMEVPPEVGRDRIAYIAVQLNETLEAANLLGFVDQVEAAEIPLSQLRSLDEFPHYLQQFRSLSAMMLPLRTWLEGAIAAGWQRVEDLLLPQPEMAFRSTAVGVRRGKRIVFDETTAPFVLLMSLNPISDEEVEIQVEVVPAATQLFLPSELQLSLLDEHTKSLLNAQTTEENPSVQLEFSAAVGDRFRLRIVLGEFVFMEDFVV